MNYKPIFIGSRLDKFVSIKIQNNDLQKTDAILILVIDNKKLKRDYNIVCQNLPRLVEKNSDFINFVEIVIIYNHPKLSTMITSIRNVYSDVSKLTRNISMN